MGIKFNPFTGAFDFTGDAASAPTGTPNTFAGYDGSGSLESILSWVRNAYGGVVISQVPTPTDIGSTQSFLYNNKSIVISPTNNLTDTYLYADLDVIDLGGTFDYRSITGREISINQTGVNDITENIVGLYPRINLGVGGVGSTSVTDHVVLANIRLSGAHVAQNITGIESQVSMDGGTTSNNAYSFTGSTYVGGTTDYAYGLNQSVQVDGTLNQTLYGINLSSYSTFVGSSVNNLIGINKTHDGNINGNSTDLNLSFVGDIGASSNNVNIYHEGEITGNANGISYFRNGASLGAFNFIAATMNSSSPVTDDFRWISLVGQNAILDFGGGIFINQSGTVTKSYGGVDVNVSADVGDGTGVGLYGYNLNVGSGTAYDIDGSLTGYSFGNSSNVLGNNNTTGFSVNNQGDGYRFIGFEAFNSNDMTEEIRGFQFNSSGDARTLSGIDLVLSGNITDDCRGVRVNVSSLTSSSTTNHVLSAEFAGGTFQVQSDFKPFSGVGVDIGNGLSVLSTIDSGSPLTGTDQIIQLIQSNLIVNDDISTGPFGLDTNMVGLVSQIAVDTAKTVPLMRSMLVGTSVPSGSGGTITEHVVLEMLGLPSFGGSVTCPTKIGIQDSTLLGAAFSDGATDSWGIRWRDVNSENYLARLAIGPASYKVANASVGLELDYTDKAVLLSRMTTTQRNALTAINGMILFNTTLSKLEYYDGTNWISV